MNSYAQKISSAYKYKPTYLRESLEFLFQLNTFYTIVGKELFTDNSVLIV